MIFNTNKQKGNAGLAVAIGYYGSHGYSVSIPLNDTQDYDIIIDKDGVLTKVNCKATSSQSSSNDDSFTIDLRNTGGTNGGVYGHTLDKDIDAIFCLDGSGRMFHIPVNDIKDFGVKNSISLVSKKPTTANSKFFDTSIYLLS
jgi:hypothetical protein